MSTAATLAKVLFVDDEPNVLSGFKRQLRSKYEIFTAESGLKGLEILQEQGPFPVVVSDMRMPNMNGAAFLSKVRKLSPHTMRILLTGQSDIESAVQAINEGQIFRFLMKPCPADSLVNTLDTAIEQNRLLTVEKELLEKTLYGSIKVLTDILSLVNPAAFSQSSRIRKYINHMTDKLQLPGKWQYDIAAMLSQIGCVTVPIEIISKVYSHQTLAPEEKKLFDSHPEIGADLIKKIPRLQRVALMIRNQHENYSSASSTSPKEMEPEILGAQMLKIALDLDQHIASGKAMHDAIHALQASKQNYHPELLNILNNLKDVKAEVTRKMVTANELTVLMVVDEDILAQNGALIVAKGQEVTDAMKARLMMISHNKGLKEPFRVVITH